jgi:hypothetical protein
MQKPPKLTKDALRNPKDRKSSFNGDKWRHEHKNSFNSRVHTVEASGPPPASSRAVSVGGLCDRRDTTGAIRSIPLGHRFQPAFRDVEELNERQVKQLTDRQRKKNKG